MLRPQLPKAMLCVKDVLIAVIKKGLKSQHFVVVPLFSRIRNDKFFPSKL